MNTKLESLKFNNVEDGWNYFRKTIWEVTSGVSGKKIKTTARNISEKALWLIESRSGLYKNYPSDRSYDKQMECKESEESIKI